ncbi:MAG: hypothetical protein ACKVH8_23360 [Pirellulales bacterium]
MPEKIGMVDFFGYPNGLAWLARQDGNNVLYFAAKHDRFLGNPVQTEIISRDLFNPKYLLNKRIHPFFGYPHAVHEEAMAQYSLLPFSKSAKRAQEQSSFRERQQPSL